MSSTTSTLLDIWVVYSVHLDYNKNVEYAYNISHFDSQEKAMNKFNFVRYTKLDKDAKVNSLSRFLDEFTIAGNLKK